MTDTVEEKQVTDQLNAMLNESSQLIMYEMDMESVIRLEQSLKLTMSSAHAYRHESDYAAEVWYQSSILNELLFMQIDEEHLISTLDGETRQEISLILMDAVEEGTISNIEDNIVNLIEDDYLILD
ncbi:hypothetical protein [Salisediminibacterium beveridgei]|uniref:hypothetical protein n=1 Tax=Salisediminibacterium beveridgei TaxID=632773 RepID=UPI0012EED7D6|nr:hypothetical protein [Salisediminibacterium beveridgei]